MNTTATPYELIPPGKPNPSTKERFAQMRDFAAMQWREENAFEDVELQKLIKPKPKKVKTRRVRDENLYRSLTK